MTVRPAARLRVLCLDPAGNLWGSERSLLSFLAVAVSDHRVELAVCCPPSTPILSELAALEIQTYPTFIADLHHRGRPARLRALGGLLRAVHAFRPDVIHVNQAGAGRIALIAARIAGAAAVIHVRMAEDAAYVAGLRVRPDTSFVCVSEDIRRELISRFKSGASHHAVNWMYDPYRHDEAGLLEGGASIPPVERLYNPYVSNRGEVVDEAVSPVFVVAGRVARTKGVAVVLEALALLRERHPSVAIVFAGAPVKGDVFEAEARQLADRLGVSDAVTWTGFHPNPRSLMRGAAGLICASYSEAFGRVLLEAWDAGTVPIAWAGSGGAAEVLDGSGGGILYEEQTGASLAAALDRAMNLTSEARRGLVASGRAWAQTQCDPEAYATRLISLFADAARAHATPEPA